MGSREGVKRLGCLLMLTTFILAAGYSTRAWFTFLEPRLTAALHCQEYHRSKLVITGLYYTAGPLGDDPICRCAGTVEGSTEYLDLRDLSPRPATSLRDLETMFKEGQTLDVLYDPSLGLRNSSRVVAYRDNFISASRWDALRGLLLTLWAPLLWLALVYFLVQRETRLWKTRRGGLG